jgi:hypothetical protein
MEKATALDSAAEIRSKVEMGVVGFDNLRTERARDRRLLGPAR